MYSTSNLTFEEIMKDAESNIKPILRYLYQINNKSGFGVGLPLSRVYAKYFGGSLEILSMNGFGTDAYLFLNRVGDIEETIQ
jgi:hypothetical protein